MSAEPIPLAKVNSCGNTTVTSTPPVEQQKLVGRKEPLNETEEAAAALQQMHQQHVAPGSAFQPQQTSTGNGNEGTFITESNSKSAAINGNHRESIPQRATEDTSVFDEAYLGNEVDRNGSGFHEDHPLNALAAVETRQEQHEQENLDKFDFPASSIYNSDLSHQLPSKANNQYFLSNHNSNPHFQPYQNAHHNTFNGNSLQVAISANAQQNPIQARDRMERSSSSAISQNIGEMPHQSQQVPPRPMGQNIARNQILPKAYGLSPEGASFNPSFDPSLDMSSLPNMGNIPNRLFDPMAMPLGVNMNFNNFNNFNVGPFPNSTLPFHAPPNRQNTQSFGVPGLPGIPGVAFFGDTKGTLKIEYSENDKKKPRKKPRRTDGDASGSTNPAILNGSAKTSVKYNKDGTPRKQRSKLHTSKYRGVSKCSKDGRWQARIRIGSTVKYLGRFKSETEAAMCYDEAAYKYHGAKAVPNFKPQQPPQGSHQSGPTNLIVYPSQNM